VTEIYKELFLMTVSRPPTGEEIAKLEQVRNGKATIELGAPAPKTGSGGKRPATVEKIPVAGAAPNDPSFYRDVFWALLNSSEFMLNH
jgi:hypothetical protein